MNLLKICLILCLTLITQTSKSQELIPYRHGELWGYCTPSKEVVIPAQFQRASVFSEGLAAVGVDCNRDCYDVFDGKYGYINTKGEWVITPQYASVRDFKDNCAYVSLDGSKWTKINNENKPIINEEEEDNPNDPGEEVWVKELNGYQIYYRCAIPLNNKKVILVEGTNLDSLNEKVQGIERKERKKGRLSSPVNDFKMNIFTPEGKVLFSDDYVKVDIISDQLFRVYLDPRGTVGYINERNLKYWEDGKEVAILYPIHSLSQNTKDEIELNVNDYEYNRHFITEYMPNPKSSAVVLQKMGDSYEVLKTYPIPDQEPVRLFDPQTRESWHLYIMSQNQELYNYWLQSLQNQDLRIMISAQIPLPELILENDLFFQLFQKGIRLTVFENENLLTYDNSINELSKPYIKSNILNNWLTEIRKAGNAWMKQDDKQQIQLSGEANPYVGQMLVKVMAEAKEEDLMAFLKYVNAAPYPYMGREYKITEAFSNWLISGAPKAPEPIKP